MICHLAKYLDLLLIYLIENPFRVTAYFNTYLTSIVKIDMVFNKSNVTKKLSHLKHIFMKKKKYILLSIFYTLYLIISFF